MTVATSLLLSRADIDFLLFDWLDTQSLFARTRFADHSRGTCRAALDLAESLAATEFAPLCAEGDRNPPRLDGQQVHLIPGLARALSALAESGLMVAAADEGDGGAQLPHVVHRACLSWLQAANIAASAYPMLSVANANLLLAHGSPAQAATFARPLLEGRFFGTMCLSEPGVGSSLGDITTRAVAGDDGTYRLFGDKMWISGGDHELAENIVHLVLARIAGAPPGVRGLSLFIVPKFLVAVDGSRGERNDVTLAGLNHKMGYRATVNTVLKFGEGTYEPSGAAGAVGYLVGAEGAGLAHMFHMMNEARIEVGSGAAALAYTGYLHALAYARSRPQGRTPENRDPRSAQVPIVRHPDVRRMLLAAKSYAEGALALVLYAARLLDDAATAPGPEDRESARLLLDVLTPVVKSWPAQWGLAANDLAIQIHGGYGYSTDYPVEQFYRDNRLNAIHEGTHGIQARDLLGRRLTVDGGAGFELLMKRIRATIDGAPALLGPLPEQLAAACQRLDFTTKLLTSCPDQSLALANASVYLEAMGHLIVAWHWLAQASAAVGQDRDLSAGKLASARYFYSYELPKVDAQLDLLDRLDPLLLDLQESWL